MVVLGGALSSTEQELARLLAELGLPRTEALVTVWLAGHGASASSGMEQALRLRQPEVSMATRALRRRGWVSAESVRGPGKGRPVNNYRLVITIQEVTARIEAERRAEIHKLEARIREARRLANEIRPATTIRPSQASGAPAPFPR